MEDRAKTVGLFRYSLIRQAADPGLSSAPAGAVGAPVGLRGASGSRR